MNSPILSVNEESKVTEEVGTMTEFDLRLRKFFNNTELTKVLKSIGLKDRKMKKFAFLDNSSDKNFDLPNDSPDRRHSLELITKAKDSQSLYNDIIVDFQFASTIENYMDVTFDVGSGYDIKIILFDDESIEIGFPRVNDDECYLEDLININNLCGVKTYLVKARGLIKHLFKGEKRRIIYTLVTGPYGKNPDFPKSVLADGESPLKMPTKRQLQESEFWICYYFPHRGGGDHERSFEYDDTIIDWTIEHSLYSDLKTKTSWNDDGLFIELSGNTGSEAIQWIWKNKKSLFEEAYPECPISLKNENGQPTSISVRIYEISMAELLEMNPEDKWHYAEIVDEAECKFITIAEEAIDDYISMNKSTKEKQHLKP